MPLWDLSIVVAVVAEMELAAVGVRGAGDGDRNADERALV
jgi:hypothetical protein